MECTMLRWLDNQGNPIVDMSRREAVWNKLSERLMHAGKYTPSLRLNDWMAHSPQRALSTATDHNSGSGGVRALEEHTIMVTFPFCLLSLMKPEMETIHDFYQDNDGARLESIQQHEAAIQARIGHLVQKHDAARAKQPTAKKVSSRKRRHWNKVDRESTDEEGISSDDDPPDGSDSDQADCGTEWQPTPQDVGRLLFLRGQEHPVDPTMEIAEIAHEWVCIYTDLRRSELDDLSLEALDERIVRWKERVMNVYPYKSGQHAGQNYQKNHEWDHAPSNIQWVGCLDNVSAQTPEQCHQLYVKLLGAVTNRHPGWEATALSKLSRMDFAAGLWEAHASAGKISRGPATDQRRATDFTDTNTMSLTWTSCRRSNPSV